MNLVGENSEKASEQFLLELSTVSRYQRRSACHRSHICEQIFIGQPCDQPQANTTKGKKKRREEAITQTKKHAGVRAPRRATLSKVDVVLSLLQHRGLAKSTKKESHRRLRKKNVSQTRKKKHNGLFCSPFLRPTHLKAKKNMNLH